MMQRSIGPRELAYVLMCALALLAYAVNAAADPATRSTPPRGDASLLLRTDFHARPDHANGPHGDNDRRRQQRQNSEKRQRPAITPEQAAQRARHRFGGRVLNVILEHGPGGPYYRVKLLENGRVRVVDIDARR
ncbi:PepSY domain-containing protein [Salinisphaera sp. RV14]|uniref:PepSY domain-containing protein n=1 Tax=unclassified Salinisphaera TaxID=2649847 RepID=UPI003F8578C4